MLPRIDVTALNLIKTEVDASLTQIEGALSTFVEDNANNGPLAESVEQMEQVYGALRLIDIHGAAELAEVLFALLRQVNDLQEKTPDIYYSALGSGMMVLGRYLEYVQIKAVNLPQLLISSINECRYALGLPPLGEGYFLDVPFLPDSNIVEPLAIDNSQAVALAKRIRLMYQIGTINLLKDEAQPVHFRLMRRALERATQLCTGKPLALLWWVGEAALEAFSQGVELNPARKRLLAQLEQQLKLLVLPQGLNQPVDMAVLANSLAVVGLGETGAKVQEVQRAFDLSSSCISQSQLKAQQEAMYGPGGSVIKTVATVLKEDIARIKEVLDVIARGSQQEEESYQTVSDAILKSSQTLIMLGLNDAANSLRAQANIVAQWTDTPTEAALNLLFDVLLQADNAVATLDKEMSPGAQTIVNNTRISLHQLDEARGMLVQESRSGIELVKRSVLSYLEGNGEDPMHLSNIPTTLQSVSGGLEFLLIPRGAAILRAAANFVDAWALSKKMPAMSIIENFADVIACVDYYLESLQENKPVSEEVFTIGEDAMAELGYPIAKRKAA
ncbi:MAG TPA: hypothetical protein PLN40_06175 [Agitococcus sp.]|nr:hypothetical protein [Agitococcus sp.]